MSHIKTYARLKPTEDLYEDYEIQGKKVFSIRVPEFVRDYGASPSKNRTPTISYDFKFERVFDTSVGQEQVYNIAAQEIVTGFLDGYNGTIFAYGQTGTGKTYTVEGNAVRYSDRGLAPRALAQIYKTLEMREGDEIAVHISYLEIYQEVAYDLLSTTARTASPVTVFPKVTVMEGASGTCQIRNLSFHLAPSEDVAHALLLQGQANRKVAETPVNQRSSRSHAVFTIYLSTRKPQSDIITRSKLHLVDLAGSERVAKTGVDGQQLTEAKSINLSLHYLESVIIALQGDLGQTPQRASSANKSNTSIVVPGTRPSSAESGRRHVPYRNSLLTMVLRDSLGGNCLTAMVATFSLELQNLGETLSTCRFAQRVARNEEIDDKTLIQHLKRRVAELESQMACLRMSQQEGGSEQHEDESSSKLTDEDKIACAHVVQEYLAGRITDPVTAGMTSPFKFRECLRILKRMVMNKYFQAKLATNPSTQSPGQSAVNGVHDSVPGDQPSSTGSQGQSGVHGEAGVTSTQTQSGQDTANSNTQEDSRAAGAPEPTTNGWMDTDDLIFNIQKLYAATHREKEERGRQGTAQTESRANSSRSPARTEGYKSPYERKREKEIRQLTNKLESMKKTQEAREQQLHQMRKNTALGELTNMESIIRNKIQVTREQIADQHAYLLHLRHTEANNEIKQREKMVEDQLLKREARFQKKLDEVLHRKAEIEAQAAQAAQAAGLEGEGQVKSGEKRTLEDQYSQYKKRNGTLNTRQVFDMLKSEEKKQTKVSKEAEVEKKVLMSKQLAQKETATREKLRELKEMLRKSQEETLLGQQSLVQAAMSGPHSSTENDNGNNVFGVHISQTSSAGEQDRKRPSEINNNDLSKTFVIEENGKVSSSATCTVEDLETSMTRGNDDEKEKDVKDRLKSGLPQRVSAGIDSSSQHQQQEKDHQSVASAPAESQERQSLSRFGSRVEVQLEARWERPYSRPSTAASSRSQEWVTPQERRRTSGLSPTSNNSSSNIRPPSGSSSPQDLTSSWRTVSTGGSDRDRTDATDEVGQNEVPVSQADTENVNDDEPRGQASPVADHNPDFESYMPTVMPSEYVRSMSSNDKFDARKMGLSSKTFDSALSSMLNDESKTVAYGFKFYDQYARSAKAAPNKSFVVRNPSRSQKNPEPRSIGVAPKESHSQKDPYAQKERLVNAWGPEAKNSPVSKRLAQFLADDGKEKAKPPLPKQDSSKAPRTDSSLTFLERLTKMQEEQSCSDEMEITSPRIQAMQDTQRESTYMGRIQAERDRISKIRRAREAAEAIQRAWRRYSQYSS
ncbi:hypothetical protein BaRGS_00017268 [Batillaria attramentaria]|uniref:Kinesin motor domain-containing protein n=1 Tax=Batillaria attramentaria TaxID=370345 RepID=A0ABD0KX05_9CAEN